ncbi:MAG TPA: hypothetical protein VEI03_02465 [Stellaceae bacterium]|nr:hypothetical protein [Stellaceae bacterium]
MVCRRIALAVAAALALGAASPALAQRHDGGWHDRDIHRFNERDVGRWRGGHWIHSWHGGRFGWWWIVGPDWYYYPRTIYPYPDPFVPPYAVPGAPAWYFCPPAQTYYPYVASCPAPWQMVPAR